MNKPKRLNLEDAEQEALIQWVDLEPCGILPGKIGDYLFAIPNGGKRNIREAARFKRQGVRAGVSDLFLAVPLFQHRWGGLFIEMKKQRQHFRSMNEAEKAVSPVQVDFMCRMGTSGYLCRAAFGWEEARKHIVEYLLHGR
jgi:hypothetical protein